MGAWMVNIFIGVVIFAAFLINLAVMRHDSHDRILICREHNRKVMLGRDLKSYSMLDDLYVSGDSLLMHNSGTAAGQHDEKAEFIPLASAEEYYL